MIQQGLGEDEKADVILQALFSHTRRFLLTLPDSLSAIRHSQLSPPHLPVDGAKPNAASRAFFLDFAINDDGERPELTKIWTTIFASVNHPAR